MKTMFQIIWIWLLCGCAFVDRYQYSESAIRVNQVGYLTSGKKQAAMVNANADSFRLFDTRGNRVYEGRILERKYWDHSDEEVGIADFSVFKEPGTYYLSAGEAVSPTFEIADGVFTDLVKATAKAYYYNRASTSLEAAYSGQYSRGYAHPDTVVYVHSSAASKEVPAGSVLSTPFGWYDAGDYNKYVVNSGISTYTLLMAYQHNSGLFDTLTWNIPESQNELPDLLDEILWNLKWMESMQDPHDGGVYHKTTTADFEGFIPAAEASGKRYVVTKGTAAALNFSAVLARASVLLNALAPEYSGRLLRQAENAWKWAIAHPEVPFKNPSSSGPGFPAISTGEYGDQQLDDEFFWAACELYLSTGKQVYLEKIKIDSREFGVPGWNSVATLGLISLSSAGSDLPEMLKKQASDELLRLAEEQLKVWRDSPYRVTIDDFHWGSNADVLNQGMILMNAYRLFGNTEFYEAALSGLDYVLGRNATGYCFVTGQGTLSPLHIHHRQSASDGIEAPIPGLLAGGPNPGNVQDDCGESKYPTMLPAKCYVDEQCSYSTNEVAINWNAPLVYLAATLQGTYLGEFKKND